MAVVWAQKKNETCAKAISSEYQSGTHREKEKANYERSRPQEKILNRGRKGTGGVVWSGPPSRGISCGRLLRNTVTYSLIHVGIPIVSLGVAIGALVGLGIVSVPVSPLGEDWIL